uniref:BZIP domain-containing protein n=1 Tax=Plectus sambesii TaxID=2011161 RepID=A0A914VEQ2_9BILA
MIDDTIDSMRNEEQDRPITPEILEIVQSLDKPKTSRLEKDKGQLETLTSNIKDKRERRQIASRKCRAKKKTEFDDLKRHNHVLEQEKNRMFLENQRLLQEIRNLKNQLTQNRRILLNVPNTL